MRNKLKAFVIAAFVCVMYCGILGMLLTPMNEAKTVSANITDGIELPIISYRAILDEKDMSGSDVVTPQTLENDIRYLKNNSFEFVLPSDLISYTDGGYLPEKPVLITFEDGLYNSYANAMPILEKCGVRGVVSVIGSSTDEYSESKIIDSVYGHLRWTEVYDMFLSSRIEVATQSYNVDFEDFYEDTRKAQDRFLSKTGFAPVVYSFSDNQDTDAVTDILKDMGFEMSISCETGTNAISRNPDTLFMLKRFTRTSDVQTEEFFEEIANHNHQ